MPTKFKSTTVMPTTVGPVDPQTIEDNPGALIDWYIGNGQTASMPADLELVTLTLMYSSSTQCFYEALGLCVGSWMPEYLQIEEPEPERVPAPTTTEGIMDEINSGLRKQNTHKVMQELMSVMKDFGCSAKDAEDIIRTARRLSE